MKPRASSGVKLALGVVGYLGCWLFAYWAVVPGDFSHVLSYFIMGWTFSGGEYPTFIWLGSLVLFGALFVLYRIASRLSNVASRRAT